MIKKKNINLRVVTWYDAVAKDLNEDYLKSLTGLESGEELLVINKNYGKVVTLKDVIIIINGESTDGESDVTIIPKQWVISII